ncbi:MAG: CRISPR-associated helicase Cas3' [candidate division KSB1 bacterium]|nr:CRISPR-associated helicase Cas3' [candidate division KSB1 bacterium]MDZ7364244.1 CRISPR-associated helicase Cas3' [candidate division KSB1 bacterium]MDZ7404967.1 CRISPR-associated helicase Cas3' [candidate division KSB1 bacterium]
MTTKPSFYSHIERDEQGRIIYKKPLLTHITEVARSAREAILALPDGFPRKNRLAELAFLIGVAHDFGKYTSFFQSYLLENADHGIAKNHSFISAVWSAFLLVSQSHNSNEDKYHEMLLAFGAILYHHGNLNNFSATLQDICAYADSQKRNSLDLKPKQTLEALFEKQLPDLLQRAAAIEEQFRTLIPNLPPLHAFQQALADPQSSFYKQLENARWFYEDKMEDATCERLHFELYLLFSALIDSDKRDAARISLEAKRLPIPESLVQRFIRQAQFVAADPVVAKIRSDLFAALEAQASEIPLTQKIFTITSPTGSGKTLAALNFAIKLRHRLAQAHGAAPRIIYALPFTSIIDQNHNVFEKVLSLLPDFAANSSRYLLKHHHLADISYVTEEVAAESLPLDKSLLLIESWESEIIVTTYVQFFHTIFSSKNRLLKKYHNLAGSLIILDEVQNLPVEYWPLARHMLRWLAEAGNCTIIMMTATQPLIFSRDEAMELVPNPRQSFRALDRIYFHIHHERQELREFAAHFAGQLQPDKSYAVILNTIKSSLEFFRFLETSDIGSHELFYLSTNIIPDHRWQRIADMRHKLEQRMPIILVSTQVIEAGVDLDFDLIYRDLAPIDSLVQAAGRANRHGIHGKGHVHIVRLADAENREFARWIYGKAHLWVTAELLKDRQELNEYKFLELVQENYEKLVKTKDLSEGENIYRDWWQCSDYEALQRFQLISAKFGYADIFLAVNPEAENVWQRYLSGVLRERDFKKRQQNYLQLRSDFRRFIISAPVKSTEEFFWSHVRGDRNKPGHIPFEAIADYYDPQTGYKRIEDDKVMIF